MSSVVWTPQDNWKQCLTNTSSPFIFRLFSFVFFMNQYPTAKSRKYITFINNIKLKKLKIKYKDFNRNTISFLTITVFFLSKSHRSQNWEKRKSERYVSIVECEYKKAHAHTHSHTYVRHKINRVFDIQYVCALTLVGQFQELFVWVLMCSFIFLTWHMQQ